MAQEHDLILKDGDVLMVRYQAVVDKIDPSFTTTRFTLTLLDSGEDATRSCLVTEDATRSCLVTEDEDSELRLKLANEIEDAIREIFAEMVETDQIGHDLAQIVYKTLGLVVEDSPDAVETPEGWRSGL